MLLVRNLLIAAVIIALSYAAVQFMGKEPPNRGPAQKTQSTPAQTNTQTSSPPSAEKETKPAQSNGEPAQANDNSEEKTEQSEAPTRRGLFGGVLARQAATSVEAMPVQFTQTQGIITLYGALQAQRTLNVRADNDATVVAVNAQEGELIAQGETALVVESDDNQTLITQRQAALAEQDAAIRIQARTHSANLAALDIEKDLLAITKRSVDRFSSLNNQQLTSSDSYETALKTYQSQLLSVQNRQLSIDLYEDTRAQQQAQRRTLVAQLEQAQQSQLTLQVSAPYDARIAKLLVSEGQTVNAGDDLAQLYDPSSLVVYARAPARYQLNQYPLDQLTVTDNNGHAWQVSAVQPIAETGGQRLTLVPIDAAALLAPLGQYLSFTLGYPTDADRTVDVPTTAVYDQQRVYIANNGALLAVPVTLVGRSERGFLIQADALNEQTQIITTRLKSPVTGTPIQVSGEQPRNGERPEGRRP